MPKTFVEVKFHHNRDNQTNPVFSQETTWPQIQAVIQAAFSTKNISESDSSYTQHKQRIVSLGKWDEKRNIYIKVVYSKTRLDNGEERYKLKSCIPVFIDSCKDAKNVYP